MNTNAKHTAGPWMQGPTANTWNKVYEGKKGEYGGRAICTLHNIHANGARQREDFETETANARLIAAAPAMLEALRKGIDALRDIINAAGNGEAYSADELHKHFTDDLEAMRQAQEQATGEA